MEGLVLRTAIPDYRFSTTARSRSYAQCLAESPEKIGWTTLIPRVDPTGIGAWRTSLQLVPQLHATEANSGRPGEI